MAVFQTSKSCSRCDFWQYCRAEYPNADPGHIFLARGIDICKNWMNWSHKDANYIIDIGTNFERLKNKYLCIGLEAWTTKANVTYQSVKPISPYILHLLISPKLTILLEARIGDQLELIWLRPDLDNIWSYNTQHVFNAVSYSKYAGEGLSAFGSKQEQSYLVRVLVEPSFTDLEMYDLIEAWVALSHYMIKMNMPYRAMEMAA